MSASPKNRLYRIAEEALCIGCGLCQSVAGRDVLEVTKTATGDLRPIVVGNLDDETVDRIYDVCPGTRIEGLPERLVEQDTKIDNVWGPWRRMALAWARTVEAMLPEHDVYVTDWTDAREVPLSDGAFDLADYTDYLREFCQFLAKDGERPAVMAVCQPGVPVLVAGSLMAAEHDPARPASMILMGSPIDTRINQTEPNRLAQSRPLSWFEKNVIVLVPWPNQGMMRRVYPGFLQLSGFMQMNLDRHMDAHFEHFHHLVEGDGDSAASHRAFYDEYLAVMDLTAEFYLQTVETVFQKHLIPKGEFTHRGHLVDPGAIQDIGLMTVEGEKDDITGRGQTRAALDLCVNLPDERKNHYVQPRVGTLWRLQRVPVPPRDPAAYPRLHSCPAQARRGLSRKPSRGRLRPNDTYPACRPALSGHRPHQ